MKRNPYAVPFDRWHSRRNPKQKSSEYGDPRARWGIEYGASGERKRRIYFAVKAQRDRKLSELLASAPADPAADGNPAYLLAELAKATLTTAQLTELVGYLNAGAR